MPMYFPDLRSIQKATELMSRHEGDKKYTGIIPKDESELPEARKQLAKYMRTVWHDEVEALEIELALTEENYDEGLDRHFREVFKKEVR